MSEESRAPQRLHGDEDMVAGDTVTTKLSECYYGV